MFKTERKSEEENRKWY